MKSILFKKPKVVLDANPVDQWVGDGVEHHPEAEPVPEEPMKRFTIDVPAGVMPLYEDLKGANLWGLLLFSAAESPVVKMTDSRDAATRQPATFCGFAILRLTDLATLRFCEKPCFQHLARNKSAILRPSADCHCGRP
jgi:hypothetical protein